MKIIASVAVAHNRESLAFWGLYHHNATVVVSALVYVRLGFGF